MTLRTIALKYAQDLIKCPSVTPEDAGAQDVIIEAMQPLGFKVTHLQYDEVRNTFLRLGGEGPHFCFAGHTDVVLPGDEKSWSFPPFAAEIRDSVLYGRGASDMKGNIACFMAAVQAYIEKHGKPNGSISFLITGDEEGEAVNGTVQVLKWMKENGQIPDHCLVGEPTNPKAPGDEMKIGRRGSLNGLITVKGQQGHVAYPHLADNPVPKMIKLLQPLTDYVFDEGSEFFPPTSFQFTTIDVGNKAENIVPEKVTAQFNVRFNDKWSKKALADKICMLLDECRVPYEIEFWGNADSFITEPNEFTALFQTVIEEITGRIPALTTTGGTSDARFVSRYCPVVEYGLCNSTMHKVDEHVALDDLAVLTEIYLNVLERYFYK